MRKYLSLFLLVLFILGMTGQILASNYWNDAGNIIKIVGEDMTKFSQDTSAFSNGTMTNTELINKISYYKDRAFNQLEKMMILYSKTPDKKMHVDLTSIISDWYLVNELMEEAMAYNNVKKVNSATQIMLLINEKIQEKTSKIQGNL